MCAFTPSPSSLTQYNSLSITSTFLALGLAQSRSRKRGRLTIWREEIQNRNRLLDLAGRNLGSAKCGRPSTVDILLSGIRPQINIASSHQRINTLLNTCSTMATPSEEELRFALASVLLVDNNDEGGVVDGIDGACRNGVMIVMFHRMIS